MVHKSLCFCTVSFTSRQLKVSICQQIFFFLRFGNWDVQRPLSYYPNGKMQPRIKCTESIHNTWPNHVWKAAVISGCWAMLRASPGAMKKVPSFELRSSVYPCLLASGCFWTFLLTSAFRNLSMMCLGFF